MINKLTIICLFFNVIYFQLLADAQEVDLFTEKVKPILSDKCFVCHGPDSGKRQGDLRLDLREDALKNSVIVPGDVEKSELLKRIKSHDPDEVMPPPTSQKTISEQEIKILADWINQGAPYAVHWSFRPVVKPEVPKSLEYAWGENEIDAFVLKRMLTQNLKPAPRATKAELLRRLTFDLTGLPPSLQEMEEFLRDESPAAYEQVVDRLLASPHFGERLTADWLDVARYSDSYGYQVDRERFVWPWRDWVVKAVNENISYKDFIIWQLAGDLLPNATDEQKLATTFCRLHPQKVEGGSTPEEFRTEYVADRAQTYATAFLGLTLECAKCHDHKYDPIAQKEFYQFYAFFNNIDEAGLHSYFTDAIPTPTMMLLSSQESSALNQTQQNIHEIEQQLQNFVAQKTWQDDFAKWREASIANIIQDVQQRLGQSLEKHSFEAKPQGQNVQVPGIAGSAIKLTGDDAVDTKVGNFKREEPFTLSMWINLPQVYERAIIAHRSRAWTDAGSRGYELIIEQGRLAAGIIHFHPGNMVYVQTKDTLPLNKWMHIALTWDGSSQAKGLKLYVDGEAQNLVIVKDHLTKTMQGGGGNHIALGERFRDRGFKEGMLDEFAVYGRQLTDLELKILAKKLPETESPAVALIEQFYLEYYSDQYSQLKKNLQALRSSYFNKQDQASEIMVMEEMPAPRRSFILARGNYDQPLGEVFANVPEFLKLSISELNTTNKQDTHHDRLALAQWTTDDKNPLTPRVAVNRFWQQLFEVGLVRTPEDFGSQGQFPTHPALLDYLAADFMEHGWDVKYLLKKIVMSETYKQSSRSIHPEVTQSWKIDPENKLLARGTSRRLSAEMVRDQALALGGNLVEEVGGNPMKPYDVEESFKPQQRDQVKDRFRRSLYTHWRRNSAPPVMIALDASGREVCRIKRESTASPLQTLILFNGPEFVESGRLLASKLMHRHLTDEALIARDMFRLVTGRTPDEFEVNLLTKLFAQELAHYHQDPQGRDQYLAAGDVPLDTTLDKDRLAAWSVVGQTLLNYHEAMYLP